MSADIGIVYIEFGGYKSFAFWNSTYNVSVWRYYLRMTVIIVLHFMTDSVYNGNKWLGFYCPCPYKYVILRASYIRPRSRYYNKTAFLRSYLKNFRETHIVAYKRRNSSSFQVKPFNTVSACKIFCFNSMGVRMYFRIRRYDISIVVNSYCCLLYTSSIQRRTDKTYNVINTSLRIY